MPPYISYERKEKKQQDKTYGQVAYERYILTARANKLAWEDLSIAMQRKWEDTADSVLSYYVERVF